MEAGSATLSLRELAGVCLHLVDGAGKIIRHVSSPECTDVGVVQKEDQTPQTVADRRAQRHIISALRARFAGIRIVGEEHDEQPQEARDQPQSAGDAIATACWPEDRMVRVEDVTVFIDPLDGTKEFVAGVEGSRELLAFVTTLLAICIKGKPALGIISEPFRGEEGTILWGGPGLGIWQRRNGVGDERFVRPEAPAAGVAVVSRSRSAGIVDDVLAHLERKGVVTSRRRVGGAGYKGACIVRGEASIWCFPRPGTSRWDAAAPQALIEAAGGKVTDRFGDVLVYDSTASDFGNHAGLVAGAPEGVHQLVVEVTAVHDVLRVQGGLYATPGVVAELLNAPAQALLDVHGGLCAAGAHSRSCHVHLAWADEAARAGRPLSVFFKRVTPSELPPRAPSKWMRDSASYLAEACFYRDFASHLRERGAQLPECYSAFVDGELELREALAAGEAERVQDVVLGAGIGFGIVMEDLDASSWEQPMELDEARLSLALDALAAFHAASMGDAALLARARAQLHAEGTYWAPRNRPAGELEALDGAWEGFLVAFRSLEPDLFDADATRGIGARLREAQRHVDDGLRGAGDRKGLCIVHGDCKAANMFFRTKGDVGPVCLPVDMQWCGVGFGAQDVAYLLLSSASLEVLADDERMRQLVLASYLDPLTARAPAGCAPDADEFMATFRLAALDYAKVVFAYQLKGRDLAWLRAGEAQLGRCVHNRSVDHLTWFVRFLLRELDRDLAA